MRQYSYRFWIAVTAVWASIIFATSCRFIERRVFIDFVKRYIPGNVPQHLWVGFWSAFGIFIVKAYHVTEYALLCTLLYFVFSARLLKNQSRALTAAAAIAALYAISDEWHQTFVPGRGGTWVDVIIDCAGIGLATGYMAWRVKSAAKIPIA
jgi:hypothetical protein